VHSATAHPLGVIRRLRAVLAVAAVGLLALSGVASAQTIFSIRGGGNGHGIGMSQYGADGYAQHGKDYRFILAHYYTGTKLGKAPANSVVRVLLSTSGEPSFSGATTNFGRRQLKAGVTYTVRPNADGTLTLLWTKTTKKGPKVQKIGPLRAPLTVSGPGPLALAGLGAYRGSLVFRPGGGSDVETVESVDLEDYVRGVISAEVPSTWPAEALKAQAVAARTYAITTNAGGADFDVYADTRSQMYGGEGAETPATDAAVAATADQVVTYHGTPVVTYFFSSSGGYTESIQNEWQGSTPEPWLVGVKDPYDGADHDPYHRWGYELTMHTAAAKLGALLKGKGTFVGIRVLKHGVSPRVITAQVVGTKGATTVSGTQLQHIFGLLTNYEIFTTIDTSAGTGSPSAARREAAARSAAQTQAVVALVPLVNSMLAGALPALHGRVFPAHGGEKLAVQVLDHKHWRTIAHTSLAADGRYDVALPGGGEYRVMYGGLTGPGVTVS
jgi:stage II sporulation protein D